MRAKPPVLRVFEALVVLAALASLAIMVAWYEVLVTEAQRMGGSAYVPLLTIMFSMGYFLCFWFAVARRASRVAYWIFFGLAFLGLVPHVADWQAFTAEGAERAYAFSTLAAQFVHVAAACVMLVPEGQRWLSRRGTGEPDAADVFD
ncbi:hypothetical protein I5E68_00390 [Novosphingobium sp. YJ-S2-02]|uniref:Uncharacterized protein n=1 Tax=Novosphingobium aureum TaxID=2792964 RepID=A0A931H8W2_9SPHN|nr:hypothetical protein [Novosphingobium aureum]MBH0111407.1 hypothetical protein [Novosphingobium aureum]